MTQDDANRIGGPGGRRQSAALQPPRPENKEMPSLKSEIFVLLTCNFAQFREEVQAAIFVSCVLLFNFFLVVPRPT